SSAAARVAAMMRTSWLVKSAKKLAAEFKRLSSENAVVISFIRAARAVHLQRGLQSFSILPDSNISIYFQNTGACLNNFPSLGRIWRNGIDDEVSKEVSRAVHSASARIRKGLSHASIEYVVARL